MEKNINLTLSKSKASAIWKIFKTMKRIDTRVRENTHIASLYIARINDKYSAYKESSKQL